MQCSHSDARYLSNHHHRLIPTQIVCTQLYARPKPVHNQNIVTFFLFLLLHHHSFPYPTQHRFPGSL